MKRATLAPKTLEMTTRSKGGTTVRGLIKAEAIVEKISVRYVSKKKTAKLPTVIKGHTTF